MSIAKIANRYGRALADVVYGKSDQVQTQQDLSEFAHMFIENPELSEVFSNPTVPMHQQKALLDALLARTQPGAHIANFLRVLAENYRLQFLPAISEAFNRIIDERMNIISAQVTTAAPIDPDQKDLLINQLRKVTGKEVRLTFHTDPSIIGGVVTQIGSEIFDGSIRNQLELLRTKLSREQAI
jgi:F-type H+-transporting ATPase subunit delta